MATMATIPANFLSLPGEVRNAIYELVVVHQEPLCLHRSSERPKLTPGLFRVNKAVHTEATQIFYSQNHFDFMRITADGIDSFLEQIGNKNAGYIRHVKIDFPELYTECECGGVHEPYSYTLGTLKNSCTDLRTITTVAIDVYGIEAMGEPLQDIEVVEAMLRAVDDSLREIPSLQDIYIETSEDYPDEETQEIMEELGWILSEVPDSDDDDEEEDDDLSDESYNDPDDFDELDDE